jgi:hypothetical protein
MNRIRIVFAAVLFLLFGTFAYAQATEEVKPPQQEDPKPENKRDEAKPAKEASLKLAKRNPLMRSMARRQSRLRMGVLRAKCPHSG